MHSDGGLDIWSHQDVRRIGDIPQSGAYPGQSAIRAVVFASEQRAFAATGFGIVELNLTYGVVQGTYLLRADGGTTPAYDLSIEGDSLFAATASGLWAVSLSDPLYLPVSWVPHPVGRISRSLTSPFIKAVFWSSLKDPWTFGSAMRGTGQSCPWIRRINLLCAAYGPVHQDFWSCVLTGSRK